MNFIYDTFVISSYTLIYAKEFLIYGVYYLICFFSLFEKQVHLLISVSLMHYCQAI